MKDVFDVLEEMINVPNVVIHQQGTPPSISMSTIHAARLFLKALDFGLKRWGKPVTQEILRKLVGEMVTKFSEPQTVVE